MSWSKSKAFHLLKLRILKYDPAAWDEFWIHPEGFILKEQLIIPHQWTQMPEKKLLTSVTLDDILHKKAEKVVLFASEIIGLHKIRDF